MIADSASTLQSAFVLSAISQLWYQPIIFPVHSMEAFIPQVSSLFICTLPPLAMI